MKHKFVLSIATIASLGACITPALTSCNKKPDGPILPASTPILSWDSSQDKPALNPKTFDDPYETTDAAISDYFADVTSFSQLFATDVMYSNWYQEDGPKPTPTNNGSVRTITEMTISSLDSTELFHDRTMNFINEITYSVTGSKETYTQAYVMCGMEYTIFKFSDEMFHSGDINIIAPKIFAYTLLYVWYEMHGEGPRDEFKKAMEDETKRLSEDDSWYVMAPDMENEGDMITFDHTNVKDEDGVMKLWWSMSPLTIATTWFKNAEFPQLSPPEQ